MTDFCPAAPMGLGAHSVTSLWLVSSIEVRLGPAGVRLRGEPAGVSTDREGGTRGEAAAPRAQEYIRACVLGPRAPGPVELLAEIMRLRLPGLAEYVDAQELMQTREEGRTR
jgi:hypothetical protein